VAVEDEDEKEEEDDWVTAPPRCAVSQVSNLLPVAREQRSADYKSAIRQIRNLRYGKQIPPQGGELLNDPRWIVVLPPTAAVEAPPVDFFRIALLEPGMRIGEHQIQAKMVGRG
jgi:hypothetical protein